MLRSVFALIIFVSSLAVGAAPAMAQSVRSTPTPSPANAKASHGKTLGRKIGLHPGANGPVSASTCNARAATMPGSAGTLGPNGSSQSTTLIAVPLGGGSAASTTRQRQIAEACSHARH